MAKWIPVAFLAAVAVGSAACKPAGNSGTAPDVTLLALHGHAGGNNLVLHVDAPSTPIAAGAFAFIQLALTATLTNPSSSPVTVSRWTQGTISAISVALENDPVSPTTTPANLARRIRNLLRPLSWWPFSRENLRI